MKHTKQSAGQIGGRATVNNHSEKNEAGKNVICPRSVGAALK
jgi:hypothetical protein